MQGGTMPINSLSAKNNVSFKKIITPSDVSFYKSMSKHYISRSNLLTEKEWPFMEKSINAYNAFVKGLDNLDTEKLQNEIYQKMNVPAKFDGNKDLAGLVSLALNIFKKLGLPLPKSISTGVLPSNIRAIHRPDTGAVVFNSKYNWSNIQNDMIMERFGEHVSTPHFLRNQLHEFMHNVHSSSLNLMAKGQEIVHNSVYNKWLKNILSKPNFREKLFDEAGMPIKNDDLAYFIKNNLSSYGAEKPCEAVADYGAKLIAESLDSKTLLPRYNPFAKDNNTSDPYLIKVMDEFLVGNFKKAQKS